MIEAADREARAFAGDLLERSQYVVTDDFLTFRNGLFALRLDLQLRKQRVGHAATAAPRRARAIRGSAP
ncbi:hypothetical protein [Rhodosalinus sp. FB01]|uniref:hypothetical protein n=1 Tax=Rhodosalinus sp. FB01 TaxID=3239194 RepID=UPI0035236A51